MLILEDRAVPVPEGKDLGPVAAATLLRDLEKALRVIRAEVATGTSPSAGQLRHVLDGLVADLTRERRTILAEAAVLGAPEIPTTPRPPADL